MENCLRRIRRHAGRIFGANRSEIARVPFYAQKKFAENRSNRNRNNAISD